MSSTGMLRAFIACGMCGAPIACAQVLTFTEASAETGVVATNYNPPTFPFGGNISGGSVGDFNNDGWQDLFVLSDTTQPDRLFMNNGDGTFTESAASWGIANTHYGVSATCADYNGDGWMDISVSSMGMYPGTPRAGRNMMYRNNGDGTFSEVAQDLGIAHRVNSLDSFATAFGDYDNDGDLDMFSTAYTLNWQGNRLWRNDLKETGAEGFTDVTAETGLEAYIDDDVSGFLSGFADMDQDGHMDIILVGDHGTSMFFRGTASGVFEDATATVDSIGGANGMGLAVSDIDGDGLFDFYISSIEYPHAPNSGNLMFRQRPDGTFDEVGLDAGLNDAGWAWGVLIVDLDHDGVPEVLSTQTADSEPTRVFKRARDGTYDQIAEACGFDHFSGGRGMVNFDYDNDGDQDVVVFSSGSFGPMQIGVWRNDLSGPNTNWLRVELDTSARGTLAPDGFGSVVRIMTPKGASVEMIDGAPNHCSSGEHGAHFGVGPVETIDWVRVEWRDGTSTTLPAVASNQILRVRAPFHPGDFNADDVLDMADIVDYVQAFGASSPAADLNGDGVLDLADVQGYIGWYLR